MGLLLVGYAIVAGPVEFWRARGTGRPLRALLHLPLYALAVGVVIAILTVWTRGLQSLSWRGTEKHTAVAAADEAADRAAPHFEKRRFAPQGEPDLPHKYDRRMPGAVRISGPH